FMQTIVKRTFQIQHPVGDVFAWLADLNNFADWFPGVLAVRELDRSAPGPGKIYVEQLRLPGGRVREVRLTVREWEPGQRLVTEGDWALLLPRMEMLFEAPSERETLVHWAMYSRQQGRPFRYLLLPLLRREMGRRADRAALGLRRSFAAGVVPVSLS